MADITFTTVTATLQDPATPLVRQSALEHIARLLQSLRMLVPVRAGSDQMARRSDAMLGDIGLSRTEAAQGTLWCRCE